MRKVPKRAPRCLRHDFALRPEADFVKFPQYYQVSFCSQHEERSRYINLEEQQCLSCPKFNNDDNYATPTFVLSSEQQLSQDQAEQMRLDHRRKMFNYTDEKSEINIPKPRSRSNYCSVCRLNYSDYLAHIESQPHKKRIQSSPYNRYILELSQKYDNHCEIKEERRTALTRYQASKKYQNTTEKQENSVQIISNPYKKVKVDEEARRAHFVQDIRRVPLPVQEQYVNPYITHNLIRPACSYPEALNHFNLNISMNLILNYPIFQFENGLLSHIAMQESLKRSLANAKQAGHYNNCQNCGGNCYKTHNYEGIFKKDKKPEVIVLDE